MNSRTDLLDRLRAALADPGVDGVLALGSAEELEVPGVAIALVDQGEVVWQGGYGVRSLGEEAPVDEHTKFMIASNTKGMATLLLSVLADEGKLRWSQPVTDLYPEFRLGSDATTKSTLVRDAAIGTDQDRKFVLVIGPGDTLAYRPIVPGRAWITMVVSTPR